MWAERYAPNFDEAVAFLRGSAAAREVEAAQKEQARRREVNRLRLFLAVLGGLVVLTGGVAVFAVQQQREAKAQTRIAEQKESEAIKQEEIALVEKARAANRSERG